MNPTERYESDLQQPHFVADPLQRYAVFHTQRLYDELLSVQLQKPGLLTKLFRHKTQPLKGLYFMGGTGRGKTYLLDCFYECLPFSEKHRVHFHRFMLEIHGWLKQLPPSPDPLQVIGAELARRYRVICLDEFHVHDIGDAMIMAGLLQALFDHGVTLAASSNISIQDLYKNGLQRERFLPAIELLEENLEEIDLKAGDDYRLHRLTHAGTYLVANANNYQQWMEQCFTELAPTIPKHAHKLHINHRDIPYVALADDVVWFDFQVLCNTPRAASDYIEIALQFHTLFLSQIPVMSESQDDVAKRFIHLVDALYDHNVKLVAAAATMPDKLYTGRRLAFAFERTKSRLYEMSSKDYMKRPHMMTYGSYSSSAG
ncbi:MAG: cell division protein ZapE [Halobacteria archaeon]|nr:cell division protein ZapE [Halobacteria archaeon]